MLVLLRFGGRRSRERTPSVLLRRLTSNRKPSIAGRLRGARRGAKALTACGARTLRRRYQCDHTEAWVIVVVAFVESNAPALTHVERGARPGGKAGRRVGGRI